MDPTLACLPQELRAHAVLLTLTFEPYHRKWGLTLKETTLTVEDPALYGIPENCSRNPLEFARYHGRWFQLPGVDEEENLDTLNEALDKCRAIAALAGDGGAA